jgi:hypothetical protein
MTDEEIERDFQIATNRSLRREALRRAAADLNATSPAGLESALARISDDVTAEAAERIDALPNGPVPKGNHS